jgi:acyl-CoA synthetase (AMP-forming)/AMP-acid ligase II
MDSEGRTFFRENENVHEAAVIGIPSEKWGETPLAFVVLRKAYWD